MGRINFTVAQLIKNYCHLGHMSKLLNRNSSYYLLGNYSNVSVIDIERSVILLKYSFNILGRIFLKNGFIAFVVNSRGVLPTIRRFKRRNFKYGILSSSR
jgi:ribosomal protein S2